MPKSLCYHELSVIVVIVIIICEQFSYHILYASMMYAVLIDLQQEMYQSYFLNEEAANETYI